jgi:hypothetical protein
MLESEVDYEENQSKKNSHDHDQQSRALKLVPGRPGDLLGEFHVGLFAIVNELSHLCI